MCLLAGYLAGLELIENSGKIITGYKAVSVCNEYKTLHSICYPEKKWKPGFIGSNWFLNKFWSTLSEKEKRRFKFPVGGPNAVFEGIHVSLTEDNAKRWTSPYFPDRTILKVKCQMEDLIGTDGSDAVFKKVFLSKAEYNKALRAKQYVEIYP